MMVKKGKIIFITGGARSGKSSFALKHASVYSGKKAYIATAEPLDNEMQERIEKHRIQRGKEWDAFEEPIMIADVIREIMGRYPVIVLDCLTLWLSNLLTRQNDENIVEAELEKFAAVLKSFQGSSGSQLFIVSNEVGMGIVPDNALSRRFRDMAGVLNQRAAEAADEAYLVVSSMPLRIKG